MKTTHPNAKITRALARLDSACTRLAVHVDRLASLAAVRDDGKLTMLALEAEGMCNALHAVYGELAAVESGVR